MMSRCDKPRAGGTGASRTMKSGDGRDRPGRDDTANRRVDIGRGAAIPIQFFDVAVTETQRVAAVAQLDRHRRRWDSGERDHIVGRRNPSRRCAVVGKDPVTPTQALSDDDHQQRGTQKNSPCPDFGLAVVATNPASFRLSLHSWTVICISYRSDRRLQTRHLIRRD